MTVLDTRDPYIQYTGTGSRLYFEYGFAWNGETVVVEVDGVPVAFEYQANGVYLAEAPALNAEIVIWRETDITQERNFTAFDAFVGSWTEDALDKLILLKQEAAIWRAQTNLRANHKLDRVTIENTQGTDPDIFLWNTDQSGVFAGEVTESMPAVGQVVQKPWDFAYFQYGPEEEGGFVDYEYMLFSTDQDSLVRFIALDYTANEYTDFGSFYVSSATSIVCDGDTLLHVAGTGAFAQKHWRGTCFSSSYFEDLGYSNSTKFMITLDGLPDQFVSVGHYGFARGFSAINYEPDLTGTLDLSTAYARNPGAGTVWKGAWDLRFGTKNLPILGNAMFLAGDTDGTNVTRLYTYKQNSGNILEIAHASSIAVNTVATDWGIDRDDGWAARISGSGFVLYDIDMDTLQISTVGTCTPTTSPVFAVLPVPGTDGAMFLTSETVGATHRLRTYSRTGTTLSLLDEIVQPSNNTNANVRFWVSPYSNRIWLQGVGSQASLHVAVDTGTGAITVPFTMAYGAGNSGYRGSFIGFLKDTLTVWGNGYTGIKAKLFQAWELDEAGTADRQPAFTDGLQAQTVLTNIGSMANTASDVGNAALFDGSSALKVDSVSTEMGTTGTFSQCIDVRLASKSTTQTLLCRARDDWNASINPEDGDWELYYDSSADRFKFRIRWNTSSFDVTASDTGAIATATKYHIDFGFNKTDGEIHIRVNGGTLYTTASGVNINRAADCAIQIGRRTSVAGQQRYLSNGSTLNQWFWFWDEKTTAQQDFMYNGGSSRAFSEL